MTLVAGMEKSIPTEYTAIPPAAYPLTLDTEEEEEHQVAASSHPVIAPIPPPSCNVDPSKLSIATGQAHASPKYLIGAIAKSDSIVIVLRGNSCMIFAHACMVY